MNYHALITVQPQWEMVRRLDEANWPGDLLMASRIETYRTRRLDAYLQQSPVVLTAWGIKDMPREVSVV